MSGTGAAPPHERWSTEAGVRCDGCGEPVADRDHALCRSRRAATDPPRFCTACGRRLVVQVMPLGWRARCVSCGPLEPAS